MVSGSLRENFQARVNRVVGIPARVIIQAPPGLGDPRFQNGRSTAAKVFAAARRLPVRCCLDGVVGRAVALHITLIGYK
jgi:hypothetical protein